MYQGSTLKSSLHDPTNGTSPLRTKCLQRSSALCSDSIGAICTRYHRLSHEVLCENVVEKFQMDAVYTQTLAFSYSLFYLQNRINNYKQTTKSTLCVNYDYATIRNTAVVQFCGNKSAKFPGKLRHITEQIYDFTQP